MVVSSFTLPVALCLAAVLLLILTIRRVRRVIEPMEADPPPAEEGGDTPVAQLEYLEKLGETLQQVGDKLDRVAGASERIATTVDKGVAGLVGLSGKFDSLTSHVATISQTMKKSVADAGAMIESGKDTGEF